MLYKLNLTNKSKFQLYSKASAMILINGFYIVQTFFGISGFLSALLTLSYIEKSNSKVNYWIILKSIVGRYFRFAPLLIFFVLFHATWLYRINSGPFWNSVTEAERQVCREVWWSNLLFMNNYYPTDQENVSFHIMEFLYKLLIKW